MIIYDVEQAVIAKCERNYKKWGLFEHNSYLSIMETQTEEDQMSTNRRICFSRRLAKLGIHRDNNQCRQEV